jgi:hypothetical protein
MFYKQRQRLVRPDDWTANELAQELYAMFSPEIALSHRGPITLYAQEGAPIIVENAIEDDPIIRVVNKDSENATDYSLYAAEQDVNPNGPFQGTVTFAQGGVFYTVTIFPVGANGPSEDVTVTLLAGATEVGQSVVVSKDADGDYFMVGSTTSQLVIPINTTLMDAWTLPIALTELGGLNYLRTRANLGYYSEGRIVAYVQNGGISGSELLIQYSDASEASWTTMSAISLNLAQGTGTNNSGWGLLPAGAKTEVVLRVAGRNGNGSDNVRLGSISIQFR